ncbi:hypothetical protein V8C86DRAFT_709795 [Haematococcus lacustris]
MQGGGRCRQWWRALAADPWPEALLVDLVATLSRRMASCSALAPWCLQLLAALAAGAPASMPRGRLTALWDEAPGPLAVSSATELLGSPSPPLTQCAATAPVEVKVLAANQEARYEALRATAAWWLGEHINAIASCSAWQRPAAATLRLPRIGAEGGQQAAGAGMVAAAAYAPQVKPVTAMERVVLAAAVAAPLLSAAITHLHRGMMTGSWEVSMACGQALAKVAARSPEPHRLLAYSLLRAVCHPPPPALTTSGTARPLTASSR